MTNSKTQYGGFLKLEDQLCFALYSTSRAITKQYAIVLGNLGITYPQYLAMLVLWEKDGILVQDIAGRLQLDGATITPLVQRMEKLGLVTRQRNTQDERRVNVFLTSRGKSLQTDASAIPNEISRRTGISAKTAALLISETDAIKTFIANQPDAD